LATPSLESSKNAGYEEFIEHYSKNRDRLFAYIYALVPHQADAEDVFQRSSLLLWSKFSDFDRGRPFLPWACSIAHYEVRNFLRSVRRDRLHFDEELVEQIAELRTRKLVEGENRLDALRLCMERLKKVDKTRSNGLMETIPRLRSLQSLAALQCKHSTTVSVLHAANYWAALSCGSNNLESLHESQKTR
jgi:RNA polymerase sigma factor (sigma-70 family)